MDQDVAFFFRDDLGFLVGGLKCSVSAVGGVGDPVLKWRNYGDV
jgi:hypothetical protein